jgi:hypothetical protein
MDENVAAKNLLLGHGCDNCHFHKFIPNSTGDWCDNMAKTPVEKTCEKWKQTDLEYRIVEMAANSMKKEIDDYVKSMILKSAGIEDLDSLKNIYGVDWKWNPTK